LLGIKNDGIVTFLGAPENFGYFNTVNGKGLASSAQPTDWNWVKVNFDTVINLRLEYQDPTIPEVEQFRIPIADHTPATLEQFIYWNRLIAERCGVKRVLTHCSGGAGRGPMMVLSYFVKQYHHTTNQALSHVCAIFSWTFRGRCRDYNLLKPSEKAQVEAVRQYETYLYPPNSAPHVKFDQKS